MISQGVYIVLNKLYILSIKLKCSRATLLVLALLYELPLAEIKTMTLK